MMKGFKAIQNRARTFSISLLVSGSSASVNRRAASFASSLGHDQLLRGGNICLTSPLVPENGKRGEQMRVRTETADVAEAEQTNGKFGFPQTKSVGKSFLYITVSELSDGSWVRWAGVYL